ncbi:MAG: alanine racemase [Gammaproteobacteria bacterium]|nr:alanine racemase [Gammaproteobacteria bacterium]
MRVIASVDLRAIRHNLLQVRRYAGDARVMAAVKADAYGHGAVPVARALAQAGADALAVACLEEAVVLRRADVGLPIVLLEGVLSADEAAAAARLALQVVVHAPWQLELLAGLPAGVAPAVWFKLDTGMHRLGFAPQQAGPLHAQAVARGWSLCGWMTHLACADEPGHPLTGQQLQRFAGALAGLPGARSIANSAALIDHPEARADWVRPGLVLYGASPFADRDAAGLGLRPAMNLDARLIAIQQVDAGETIGYGAVYAAERPLRVGIIAAGYADGVHRVLPSGTPLLLGQRRVPLVGRVSMDMLAVDLTAVAAARIGDTVRLWGEGLPAEQIARRAGTLAYELFCGLTRRVHFRYHD